MGRPAIVDTEDLLRVAREIFLAQGFAVPTATIARAAGISEGSIYKRFATKEDLFFAAMGFPEPTWAVGLRERAGQGEIRAALAELFLSLIDFFRELIPRTMMMWSCRALAHSSVLFQRPDSPVRRSVITLAAYLESEMALGRLRRTSSDAVARVLLGTAHNFVFYEIMGLDLRETTASPPPAVADPLRSEARDAHAFTEEIIDLLMHGLLPATSAIEAPLGPRP